MLWSVCTERGRGRVHPYNPPVAIHPLLSTRCYPPVAIHPSLFIPPLSIPRYCATRYRSARTKHGGPLEHRGGSRLPGLRHCLRNGFDAGADRRKVIPWEIERSWSRGAVSVAIKGSWGGVAAIRLHHRHSLRVVAAATGGERRAPRPSTSPSERPDRREEVLSECALSEASVACGEVLLG